MERSNCNTRNTSASDQGTWDVDFGQPNGDNNPGITLSPGMGGGANIQDEDGDNSSVNWGIPARTLHVNVQGNEAHGHDWKPGEDVILTIKSGDTTLYTETRQAKDESCGSPCFDLNSKTDPQGHTFTLAVGQVVTLSGGGVTKDSHDFRPKKSTELSVDKDTISGVANTGSTISVDFHSQNGGRRVVAGSDGKWTADFSQPGQNGEPKLDLIAGDHGRAIQLNPDGTDTTAHSSTGMCDHTTHRFGR